MPRAILGNIPSATAHGTSADSNTCASVLSSRYINFTKKRREGREGCSMNLELGLKSENSVIFTTLLDWIIPQVTS